MAAAPESSCTRHKSEAMMVENAAATNEPTHTRHEINEEMTKMTMTSRLISLVHVHFRFLNVNG